MVKLWINLNLNIINAIQAPNASNEVKIENTPSIIMATYCESKPWALSALIPLKATLKTNKKILELKSNV